MCGCVGGDGGERNTRGACQRLHSRIFRLGGASQLLVLCMCREWFCLRLYVEIWTKKYSYYLYMLDFKYS